MKLEFRIDSTEKHQTAPEQHRSGTGAVPEQQKQYQSITRAALLDFPMASKTKDCCLTARLTRPKCDTCLHFCFFNEFPTCNLQQRYDELDGVERHPSNEGKVSHETEYDSNMIPRHSLVIDWTKRVKTLSEAFEPLNKPSFSSLAMPPWRPTTTSQCADKLHK